MSVDSEIWANGHVLATIFPDASITYATMDALCAELHAVEPSVKFDNREWLGRVHYILFLGSFDAAKAAFEKVTAGDGRRWIIMTSGDYLSQPQAYSEDSTDNQ